MALVDELIDIVVGYATEGWEVVQARVVPAIEDLRFWNSAKTFNATVLYADLANSTFLVDNHPPEVCAALYKSYLECAARLVRRHGGEITSFDGDRIMAIFMGEGMETAAGLTALKLNTAVRSIIRPTFAKVYKAFPPMAIRHAVGIDTSPIFATKIGVRAAADIVWIGRAANYAAKLSAVRSAAFGVYATGRSYRGMGSRVRTSNGDGLWGTYAWEKMTVYRSTACLPI